MRTTTTLQVTYLPEFVSPTYLLGLAVSGRETEAEINRVMVDAGIKASRLVKATNKRGTTVFYLYFDTDANLYNYKELLAKKYNLNVIVCSQVSRALVNISEHLRFSTASSVRAHCLDKRILANT